VRNVRGDRNGSAAFDRRAKDILSAVKTASLTLFLLCAATALAGSLDDLSLLGLGIEMHQRRGNFDFGNDHVQEINRNTLMVTDVRVGKRWRLNKSSRLQVTGLLGFGTVTDDTLPEADFSNGTYKTTINTKLFHGGLLADVQFPFRVSSDGTWFFHAGGGAHAVQVTESETKIGEPLIRIDDPYLESHGFRYCASIHGGLGFEIAVSQNFGVAFCHSLRYWRPVSYETSRDLFPLAPVRYYERFLSHEVEIQFLVRR
jgi:hypothetical protein